MINVTANSIVSRAYRKSVHEDFIKMCFSSLTVGCAAAEDGSFPTLTVIGSLMGATAGVLVVMVIIWCRRRRSFKRCERLAKIHVSLYDVAEHVRACVRARVWVCVC